MEGRFPNIGEKVSNEVFVSKVIAQRLSLEIGDDVSAYFQNSLDQKLPNIRKFKIVGFFLSGFPDFDQTFVLGDIKHVQRLNKWKENQIGGYEVFLDDLDEVSKVGSTLYKKLPSDLDVVELTQQYASIFQWISLFDFNILYHNHRDDHCRCYQHVYCSVGFDFGAFSDDWTVKNSWG